MDGVDLHGNSIANYREDLLTTTTRIKIRGKKTWWPLFTSLLDSVCTNSWKIYRKATGHKMSQNDFRSYVALTLIKGDRVNNGNYKEIYLNGPSYPKNGRPSRNSLPAGIKKDNVGHIIERNV
jgi:hypothetical protein